MVTVVNAIVNRHQQRGRRKEGEPQNSQSPETEPNYKAICRQLTQKTQQLGKAYKTIEAQYDELKESCQDKDEQLNQAQQCLFCKVCASRSQCKKTSIELTFKTNF